MITEIAKAVSSTLSFGFKLIDRFIPDKEKAAKAKLELLEMEQNGELKIIEQQSQIIQSEIKSDSKLAKNWRPILMLSFVAIIVNNYILAPYIHALTGFAAPELNLPPDMWAVLKLGIGGYVVGRSAEKVMKEWRNK